MRKPPSPSLQSRGAERGTQRALASPPPLRRPLQAPAGPPAPPQTPRPGRLPAGAPSATFPPEEGHGRARVGSKGAGGLSRGGPGSPHSATDPDVRVCSGCRTSAKRDPSSRCGPHSLLEMPRKALPPYYQQAASPEFRSFPARGFTGGRAAGPAPVLG